MKKLLLALSFLCGLQLADAQPLELLETDWYVTNVFLDGVTYPTPIVNVIGIVDPNIVFEETSAYAVLDPGSDSFFSDVSYDPVELEFTFLNPAITLPGCQQYCDFAIVYFGLLFGDGVDVLFTYIIDITDNGGLLLQITDEAGNYAQYQDTPVLGMNDLYTLDIVLYPNPTQDVLFIASETAVIEEIAIYDLNGQLVLEEAEDLSKVNVSKFQAGLYFVEITSEEGRAIQKFIKQ